MNYKIPKLDPRTPKIHNPTITAARRMVRYNYEFYDKM